MKTKKRIELIPIVAVATAIIPSLAGGTSAPVPEHPDAIRPFHFKASEKELADLRKRIVATRWPERELVGDATQGVQLATMKKLADYWAKDYDWRKTEKKLNSYPQFVTNIDGVDIQFIHVKSKIQTRCRSSLRTDGRARSLSS